MTINANTFFTPCGCDTKAIDSPTTIYVAPSASIDNLIPVGNDETGDGSYDRPFYSLKRAVEYLDEFNISSDIEIRGLPGVYNYNQNYNMYTNNSELQRVTIKYDYKATINGTQYYHETTVTAAVSVVNNSDHDLVTFTVADIGTGLYQFQVGDFIFIEPLFPDGLNGQNAAWAGFFEITAINGNNVTIKYIRNQISGSYATLHSYILPTSFVSGSTIKVSKLSTLIKINTNSQSIDYGTYFVFDSGVGDIVINMIHDASDTNRVYALNVNNNGKFSLSGCFALFKSYSSVSIINSSVHFGDEDADIPLCVTGSYNDVCINTNCSAYIYKLYSQFGLYGITVSDTFYIASISIGCTFTNCFNDAINLYGGNIKSVYQLNNIIMYIGYCRNAIQSWYDSTIELYYTILEHCNIGISGKTATILLWDDLSNNSLCIIRNNTYGIYLASSSIDYRYGTIQNNTYGISLSSNSICNIRSSVMSGNNSDLRVYTGSSIYLSNSNSYSTNVAIDAAPTYGNNLSGAYIIRL